MKDKLFNWALTKLIDAQESGLYGCLIIHFENGKITLIKTEKTEKPPV